LRTIAGFSKILLTEHKAQLSKQVVEFLEIIDTNARRMNVLVKDLLAFSKLGKSDIAFSPVDMNMLVEQVLTALLTETTNHKANIILQNLQPAVCDASLVKQVWYNLIENAMKYSAKKENQLIEIGMTEIGDESVYFVKDNGAGFDMQYADKLFAVFERIHTQEEFEGSGIGLATVYRVITKHGGRVWAEAKPDEGATFYFTLS
jgi:light-regulated signal transduction histidine kinase (bacteriophytochrome)